MRNRSRQEACRPWAWLIFDVSQKMKRTTIAPTIEERVIAFADLKGFHIRISAGSRPEKVFDFLSDYYASVQSAIDGSEGRVVKFMGDAVLMVFPATNPKHAIAALRRLKTDIDSFLVGAHFDSRCRIKAHIGTVAVGALGTGELERFDVCGVEVNQAALLPDREWMLSEELQKRAKG